MSASPNKLRLSSPLKMEEKAHLIQKQGIVSILGSDCEKSKTASLRRTFSADMSKWFVADNHSRSMKKIASSHQFPVSSTTDSSSSSSEEDSDYECNNRPGRLSQSDVWRTIQKAKETEKAGQADDWSSILCHKADEDSSKLPPYIHPLLKKSTGSLTERSLLICTESLGSETGSDGFSSYPASETGTDTGEEGDHSLLLVAPAEEKKESVSFDRDEFRAPPKQTKKYSAVVRSFPPPLPSLSSRDRPSLQMQSRRENGRLVLEAVSVPSRNYFHAQREDGRLLLTLLNSHPSQGPTIIEPEEDKVGEFEEVFDNEIEIRSKEEYEEEEDEDEDEDGENEMGSVTEKLAPKVSSGVINVHRSAQMMKKLMSNSRWTGTPKFNKATDLVDVDVDVEDYEEEKVATLPQSLPPPTRAAGLIPATPSAAAATSFNAYEYFWRTKPAGVSTMMSPLSQPCAPLKNGCNKVMSLSNPSPKAYGQQDLVVYRGNNTEQLGAFQRWGCKEPKRSLSIWEPHCIATS